VEVIPLPVWVVRAGRYGETERIALEKGVAVLGWDALPDLSAFEVAEDVARVVRETYPNEKADALKNWLDQVWTFRSRMKVGDLVVLPFRNRSAVAVGRVSGPYRYRTNLGEGARHTRSVDWLQASLPPHAFDKDLLWAFGAFMTVAEVSCDGADHRIEMVLRDPDYTTSELFDPEYFHIDEVNRKLEHVLEDTPESARHLLTTSMLDGDMPVTIEVGTRRSRKR
jgi:restriction system protein